MITVITIGSTDPLPWWLVGVDRAATTAGASLEVLVPAVGPVVVAAVSGAPGDALTDVPRAPGAVHPRAEPPRGSLAELWLDPPSSRVPRPQASCGGRATG